MNKLLKGIKKIGYFIPITFYLLVFIACVIPGYIWLKSLTKLPDSAYKDILSLILYIVIIFCVAILCLGFVSVLISFVYFYYKIKKQQVEISIQTSNKTQTNFKSKLLSIHINPLLRPLMGFIKVRVLYDKEFYSDKFAPISNKNSLFNLAFDGEFNWNLPQIREYKVEKLVIYFEDFFQFFSFATSVNTTNRFYVKPVQENLNKMSFSPRKTEDTSIRIDELKRVEGELINYKNFENNDDVRRIVWKIYAKNKELVVRIPEIMDPFASHIYLYSSFFCDFNIAGNDIIEDHFLNYYKTMCWSIYQELSKKGFEVKYLSDQVVMPHTEITEETERVNYNIAVSNWQNGVEIKDFVKTQNTSVLIVSSLSNCDQVKEFVENFGSDISILFIKLSDSLDENKLKDWIKWVFLENENDKMEAYKTKWNLSTLRFKIVENENNLKKLMKQSSKSMVI